MIGLRSVFAGYAELLGNNIDLARVSRRSYDFSLLSGFLATANAISDLKGDNKQLSKETKLGATASAAGAIVGTIALAKSAITLPEK